MKAEQDGRLSPVLMGGPVVLVVDDDTSIRRLLGVLLERNGYRARLATDGVEARSAIETEEVSLILCDHHLHAESGLTLVRDLLRRSPRTVALIMSGDGMSQQSTGPLGEGISGYVAKPFDAKDVVKRIGQALCGRTLGGAPV